MIVFLRINAVIDNPNALWIDVEKTQYIPLGFLRDSNYRISHLHCGALQPTRTVVAVSQLLAFPWTQGFQRMDGQNHRNVIVNFGENCPKMCVPGVAMDDICVDAYSIEIDRSADRSEDRVQVFWTMEDCRIYAKSSHL